MAIHNVSVNLININPITRQAIDKNTATIKEMLNSQLEMRVMPNPSIPNSSGYPTLQEYIALEEDDGFFLVEGNHVTTVIITQEVVGRRQVIDNNLDNVVDVNGNQIVIGAVS